MEVDEAVLRGCCRASGSASLTRSSGVHPEQDAGGEVMDESVYAGQGIRELGEKTSGFSGSDLKQLCTNAA